MTGENELLPCPFCGETAIHMHSNEDRRFFWAECSKCDVEARGADSEADAREQWNRRPSPVVGEGADERPFGLSPLEQERIRSGLIAGLEKAYWAGSEVNQDFDALTEADAILAALNPTPSQQQEPGQ